MLQVVDQTRNAVWRNPKLCVLYSKKTFKFIIYFHFFLQKRKANFTAALFKANQPKQNKKVDQNCIHKKCAFYKQKSHFDETFSIDLA